jgi:hypothetical protein
VDDAEIDDAYKSFSSMSASTPCLEKKYTMRILQRIILVHCQLEVFEHASGNS